MSLSPYSVVVFSQQTGNVIPNASIEIKNRNADGTSGTYAAIYEDPEGSTPITQPGASANSRGTLVFYSSSGALNAEYFVDGSTFSQPVDVGLTTNSANNKFGRKPYNSLIDAINDTNLKVGDAISTIGRSSEGDGGGGDYVVVASGTGVDDGGSYLDTANGLQLKLLIKDKITPELFGCVRDGSSNRVEVQKALLFASELKRPLTLLGGMPYVIDDTLWIPSNTVIKGEGGLNKTTTIKRIDGGFTDLIIAGEYSEGLETTIAPRVLKYRHGTPYTIDNIGQNIHIDGVYIDGNGDNAGFAPELGSGTDYRGYNIFLRYVDGVRLNDVFSQYAPNDCCQIGYSRRVSITNCEFSDNRLLNFKDIRAQSSRNCLTLSGTLNTAVVSDPDYFIIQNVVARNSEDLGVALQAVTADAVLAGVWNIDNIITSGCAAYGTAIEVYGNGSNQPIRSNVNISNVHSYGDANISLEGGIFSGVAIVGKSPIVVSKLNINNITVTDSGGHGFLLNDVDNTNVSNVVVDGYGLLGDGSFSVGIFALNSGNQKAALNISNFTVNGGDRALGDSYGFSASGYKLKASMGKIDGTSYSSVANSAALSSSCISCDLSMIEVANSATNGFRFTGFEQLSVMSCKAINSGKGGGSAQAIGFNIGSGSNRIGKFWGCYSYDNQAQPTQTIGYLLNASTTDEVTITECHGFGNILDIVSNLGMTNARIYSNNFSYTYLNQPNQIGSGGFEAGFKLGSYHFWVDTSGVFRMKFGQPNSDTDGTVVGLQT